MTETTSETRDKRNGVILHATIEVANRQIERRVRNLSKYGACIDHDGELEAGMTVAVAMGSLDDLVGTVMWAKPTLAGLRFDRAIDLDAARARRTAATKVVPRAGWITDLRPAYHKV